MVYLFWDDYRRLSYIFFFIYIILELLLAFWSFLADFLLLFPTSLTSLGANSHLGNYCFSCLNFAFASRIYCL
jgi:hypothetical protein